MNTPSNNKPESAGASTPGHSRSSTQPFYWSVWRELWENRSIYAAPLIVAVVVLFGFLVSTIGMPERRQGVLLLDPAHQRAAIGMAAFDRTVVKSETGSDFQKRMLRSRRSLCSASRQ